MVANGIFMSKLVYLIQLWGYSDKYLLKTIQILQNKAARVVTGKTWWTPVRILLKDCKWLSINQLVFLVAKQLQKSPLSDVGLFQLAKLGKSREIGGNMDIWKYGKMEIWKYENMEIWKYENVEIWMYGNMEI